MTDLGRKLLQYSGFHGEAREIRQLCDAAWYQDRLIELAGTLERDPAGVRSEAREYLQEMAATLDIRTVQTRRGFNRWFMRAYDVVVPDDQIERLRALDGTATMAFAFSHRSYLDAILLPEVILANRLTPTLTYGGANMNFFPIGTVAKRTGVIHIRRQTKKNPVYRLALRAYTAQLVRNHANLSWSIEGGRTRTGKLRPPTYGILRYIVDAVDDTDGADGPEVYLVPTSIVYDQLHEVAAMTSEAYGDAKRPEDFRFLLRLARQQGRRLGRAYLNFGEPVPLRAYLAELRADDNASGREVERVALDVEHRINRATPVTVTAVVSLALLGAGRSLTVDEVLATVRPLAGYIAARNWAIAGGADLTDRSTIQRTLRELAASEVVSSYHAGAEPVWGIAEHQHLVAAFYRNTAIHILIDRAIAELALLAATEEPAGGAETPAIVRDEALRLRSLLKFEFLFSARAEFENDLTGELRLIGPAGQCVAATCGRDTARRLLESSDLLLAHLVLRPFLDAYRIVAEVLAGHGDETVDEKQLLAQCLQVGKQWVLQRRVASAESRSMELFKTALRLARHRGLIDAAETPDIAARRSEFADEIATAVRRVNEIAALAGRA